MSEQVTSLRGRVLQTLSMGCAVLAYGLLARAMWWLCDDAFISFRYSRHLAQGEGLRFNLGEGPAVEGYSNLLWVLLAAVPEALGWGAPEVMPWLSLLLGAGVVVGTGHVLRRAEMPPDVVVGGMLWVGTQPAFAAWGTSGLATMAHAWAVMALTVVLARPATAAVPWWLPAALSAGLVGVRAEGVLWLGLILLGALLADRRAGTQRVWRSAALGGAVAFSLWLAWKLAYHGMLLPNTVKAKAAVGWAMWLRGLAYLALWAGTLVTPLLCGGLAAFALRRGPTPAQVRWVVVWIGVVGLCVAAGGDYMPWFRFVAVGWAPLVLLAVPVLRQWRPGARAVVVVTGVVLNVLPLVPVHLVPTGALNAAHQVVGAKTARFTPMAKLWSKERQKLPRRRKKARALAGVTQPGDRLVAKGMGVLGYETELVLLDRYGLVSTEVADQPVTELTAPGHDRRVDRAFFLRAKPDWLFAEPLYQRGVGEVLALMPKQWGLFEEVDGLTVVAELRDPPLQVPPWAPTEVLLVRPLREGEDPAVLRRAFKDAVRAAGYRAPKLDPLSERRLDVVREKRASHSD